MKRGRVRKIGIFLGEKGGETKRAMVDVRVVIRFASDLYDVGRCVFMIGSGRRKNQRETKYA